MPTTVVVSDEALMALSREISVPAATLRRALSTLNAELTAIGNVWGDDEIGKQWAEHYVPGLESVRENLEAIIEGLSSLSGDFGVMAATYVSAESANLA